MYIRLLWELEQKNKLTQQKEARVKEIQEELKMVDEIKSLEDQIAETKSLLESFLKRKREIENEKESNDVQLKSIIEGLDNNKFKSAKELKVAKKNQENLLAKGEEIEHNWQFVLGEIKEKDERISMLNTKIEEYLKTINRIQHEYDELEKEIVRESGKFKKEFEEKTKDISFNILHRYLEILEQFPHGAIATVEHGHCSYCGAQAPLEVLEHLKEHLSEEIVQCEVCGKILYSPKDSK